MYRPAMRGASLLLSLSLLPLTLALAACDGGSDTAGSGASAGSGAGASGGSGAGGSGSGGATGGGDTGGGGAADHTTPDPQFLPTPTSACPELVDGTITVSPDGNPRDVRLWISDAAKTLDGPVVFFWHGAGGQPSEAEYALSSAVIDEIVAAGGIVAAPVHDPDAGQLPWYLSLGGTNEADLRVMDEVLACAIEKVGVDQRRIHSVGFSAGAMNTMQVGWRRSGYIASIVTYSGAQLGSPPDQDPTNLFPAMTFHGGPNDVVIINFKDNTEKYVQYMKDEGHFAFICDHGKEHSVPSAARPSAWQFLKDHPFGTSPEPYANGLPEGFPAYCAL